MRKMRIVWNIIILIFLLSGIWLLFVVTRTIQIDQPNSNLDVIPESADGVIYIDGNRLIGKSIQDIAFNAQDEELFQLMIDHIESRSGSKAEELNPGINLNSSVILFSSKFSDKIFYGALFNITNKNMFDSNMDAFINENQLSGRIGEVGYILSSVDPSVDKNWLKKRSLSLFGKCSKEIPKRLKSQNYPICYWYKNAETQRLNQVNLRFEGHALVLTGDVFNGKTPESKNATFLKPDGLHLSSSVVPQIFNDSLQAVFGSGLPELASFSINYYGAELPLDGSLGVIPNSDLFITFKTPVKIEQILDSIADLPLSTSKIDQFSISGRQLFYKQLNTKAIFIGEHQFSESILQESDLTFEASGDLSLLMEIKGSNIMIKFLEIIPIYTASKRLTKNIEDFNVTITKEISKNLNGEIVFTKEHYPLNEIIRWLLEGKLVDEL